MSVSDPCALVLRLCFSVSVVALGCLECTAACLGFAACPAVACNLLAAGLACAIGGASFAVSHLAAVLTLAASAAARRDRGRLARQLAEEDNAEEEPPRPLEPNEDSANSTLHADIARWFSDQLEAENTDMIKGDSGGNQAGRRGVAFLLGSFASGIGEFYRHNADPAQRERRHLVVLLICLPVSLGYALPLYELLHAQHPLPEGCALDDLLGTLARTAVWLRAGVAGAALLICMCFTGANLVRRRMSSGRRAQRLRPEKPRPHTKLFR